MATPPPYIKRKPNTLSPPPFRPQQVYSHEGAADDRSEFPPPPSGFPGFSALQSKLFLLSAVIAIIICIIALTWFGIDSAQIRRWSTTLLGTSIISESRTPSQTQASSQTKDDHPADTGMPLRAFTRPAEPLPEASQSPPQMEVSEGVLQAQDAMAFLQSFEQLVKRLNYLRGTERLITYADPESNPKNLANYRRARNDSIAAIEEFSREYLIGLQKLHQLPQETQEIIIEQLAKAIGYNSETIQWWSYIIRQDLKTPPDSFVEGAWAEKVGQQIESQGNYKFER